MGLNSTIYDVQIRYGVSGNASGALAGIVGHAERAERSLFSLKGIIAGIGAFGAMRAAKSAFVDFNSEVQQAKIGMAGVAMMFDKNLSMDSAKSVAEDFFQTYQKEAVKSIATTQDFLRMHQMILPSALKAGASQKELKNLVTAATTAAPSLLAGTPDAAGVFGRDIMQMLMGSVTIRDQGARIILAQAKMGVEEYNKKARSDPSWALQFINQALNTSALEQMRKEQEESTLGLFSTLKDRAQILMGEAGKPFVSMIDKTMKDIRDWMADNPAKLQEIVQSVSAGLVFAFNTVKNTLQFVIDHKEMLLALFAGSHLLKGGSLGGGGAPGMAGMLKGLGSGAGAAAMPLAMMSLFGRAAKNQKTTLDEVMDNFHLLSTGLALLPGPVGAVAAGFSLLQSALNLFIGWIEDRQRTGIGAKAEWESLASYSPITENGKWVSRLKEMGLVQQGPFAGGLTHLNEEQAKSKLYDMAVAAGKGDARAAAERSIVFNNAKTAVAAFEGLAFKPKDGEEVKRPTGQKGDMNINIQKIEVPAADPDRFVHSLVRKLEEVSRHGVGANKAVRQ